MQRPNQENQKSEKEDGANTQVYEVETNENSKNGITLSKTSSLKKSLHKKSVEFFPKEMNIEELDESEEIQRKYSLENELVIKDFVPKLRPIEINLIPSKLRLNRKGFKDLKRNRNNKILLNSNKYYISCPNSEEEDSEKFLSSKDILPFCEKKDEKISSSNEICSEKNKDIDMKFTRKVLFNTKHKNIPKVHSKNEVVIKGKFKKDLDLGNTSESELSDNEEIDNCSLLMYEDKKEEKNEKMDNGEKEKNRNRANSLSILDMLRKKSFVEEE